MYELFEGVEKIKMGRPKGYKVTEETKRKIGLGNSITLKGNTYPNKSKWKKGNIPWNKDKKTGKQSKEIIKKRSNSMKDWHKKNKFTDKYKERNRKIAISQMGDKNNSKSKQAREKNRQAHLGFKSFLWNGGTSYEPYSVDWTDTLKRAIKERDYFMCQLCGKDDYLVVHHIDYNKKNCNVDNLITLCPSCHSKTNINREQWKKIFQRIMMLN